MAVNDIEIQAKPGSSSTSSTGGSGGGCACGGHDDATPLLDARQIPHAIRHATVFGALSAIAPGFALDLLAPHNPTPLLNQIQERHPGDFAFSYVTEGPQDWVVRITRQLPA